MDVRELDAREIDDVAGGFGAVGAVIGGVVGGISRALSGGSAGEIARDTALGALGGATGAGLVTQAGRVGAAIAGNTVTQTAINNW